MVQQHQVAVVADSSCCLPREFLEKLRIHVVPHELIIEERAYRDGIDIGPAEFYLLLQKNQTQPTTSSPKPASFLNTFRLASAEADSVVCVTLSANFSNTYESACAAAQMADTELPGCHIEVVDSRSAAGAQGLIALAAASTAQAGGNLERVIRSIEELIPKVNLLAFLDTLHFLGRSGRVPKVAVWAGSLLGIKPLTELKLGEARMLEKPRSRARATERLLAMMKGRVEGRPAHVNVMHADAQEDAENLCRRVEAEINGRELFISEFTPVMGTHLGPGLLGLAFYADEPTQSVSD